MGKNKLKKFAEMETFHNVFQCGAKGVFAQDAILQMAGKWRDVYFHNSHPIVLELGCGRGEYTIGLAIKNPEINYIGVDIKGARIWAGAKQAEMAGLSNVAFLRTNIEMLPSFFSPDEIDEIWITFPDPQMRKATKRLTSTFFMNRYRQVLQANGIIHLKTDSPFLYTYTRSMVEINSLPIIANTDDLYAAPKGTVVEDAQGLQTHYEKQWLERGMTIKFIAWRLPVDNILVEPDIEIEKDTYRSYGRNYVSKTDY